MKKILEKIKQYLGLIDDIIVDFLGDLKSLRYWLIVSAWVFNFYIAYAVVKNGLDWKVLTVSGGFLSVVYAFFFSSKAKEAEMNNIQPNIVEVRKDMDIKRDPDDIDQDDIGQNKD
jgi:hypothetical protein